MLIMPLPARFIMKVRDTFLLGKFWTDEHSSQEKSIKSSEPV